MNPQAPIRSAIVCVRLSGRPAFLSAAQDVSKQVRPLWDKLATARALQASGNSRVAPSARQRPIAPPAASASPATRLCRSGGVELPGGAQWAPGRGHGPTGPGKDAAVPVWRGADQAAGLRGLGLRSAVPVAHLKRGRNMVSTSRPARPKRGRFLAAPLAPTALTYRPPPHRPVRIFHRPTISDLQYSCPCPSCPFCDFQACRQSRCGPRFADRAFTLRRCDVLSL